MKNTKNSTSKAIKVILLFYIIGNLLFAGMMYLLDDMTNIKEVIVKTSISVWFGIFMLLMIEALERLERKRWSKKSQDYFQGRKGCKLLRCSSAYFQFPIETILIDILVFVLAGIWEQF